MTGFTKVGLGLAMMDTYLRGPCVGANVNSLFDWGAYIIWEIRPNVSVAWFARMEEDDCFTKYIVLECEKILETFSGV